MENKLIEFPIYFSDLNEDAQQRLMELVHIDYPREMNWDIDMAPIGVYNTYVEEE